MKYVVHARARRTISEPDVVVEQVLDLEPHEPLKQATTALEDEGWIAVRAYQAVPLHLIPDWCGHEHTSRDTTADGGEHDASLS